MRTPVTGRALATAAAMKAGLIGEGQGRSKGGVWAGAAMTYKGACPARALDRTVKKRGKP